jgi:hypothetical protein
MLFPKIFILFVYFSSTVIYTDTPKVSPDGEYFQQHDKYYAELRRKYEDNERREELQRQMREREQIVNENYYRMRKNTKAESGDKPQTLNG